MKKLLLVSLAAALAQAASASTAPDVTLRVTPERDYVYRLGPREVIVQVEVEARKNDDARRSPMTRMYLFDLRDGAVHEDDPFCAPAPISRPRSELDRLKRSSLRGQKLAMPFRVRCR